MKSISFYYILLSSMLIFSHSLVRADTDGEKSCEVSKPTLSCPLCGGINVTDCMECNGYISSDFIQNKCFRRRLFSKKHFLSYDIVGVVIWFLAAGVATACGVGGGGVYVPLGMLIMKFNPKTASGLSQCSIFGASVGGLIINIMAAHPKTNIREATLKLSDEQYIEAGMKFFTRPRIDYDMALFLAPMEMAGAVLGVMVQNVLPNWLYLILAAFILALTGYKTYQKFLSTRKKEMNIEAQSIHLDEERVLPGSERSVRENIESLDSKVRNIEEPSQDLHDIGIMETDSEPSVNLQSKNISPGSGMEIGINTGDKSSEKRRELLEKDSIQYPQEKIVALCVLWAGLSILILLKGGKGVESLIGITCQSRWYYILIAAQFAWTFGFAIIYGRKLLSKQAERTAVDYPFLPDDVIWDVKKLKFYSAFTFVAGVVAGLIGIGGGMILGPLMLIMGIHPTVSSATTATMIVLTSSSVSVLFLTSGKVPFDYAILFFFTCFVGALIGKIYIDGYVKKSGKASILIFILAMIIVLAATGCFYLAFSRLKTNNWCFDGFNALCDKTLLLGSTCPLSLNATRALVHLFSV